MKDPIHIISLGAGVQSSTMALMAAAGEITPMPTCAIFADTQAEPKSVYVWLDWLEKQLPFPVHRVTKGSLTEDSLTMRGGKDGKPLYTRSLIPAFVKNPDGSQGLMGRRCTADYKVKIIESKLRKISDVQRGQKTVSAIQWIGISVDEIYRMKPSRVAWARHRWPLVDLRMNRNNCLNWMSVHGFPQPPRSACIYCPYHNDEEWKRLRDSEPEEFSKAAQFERDFQTSKAKSNNIEGVPFLHRSMKPLQEVDFSTEEDRGQINLFNNECEGMCGV